MQEKTQKFSPIKQRILHFIDSLNISKRDFYARTGISRGTLESPTGITEDTISKVFATYTNLSPAWVVAGIGDMLINPNDANKNVDVNVDVNVDLLNKNREVKGEVLEENTPMVSEPAAQYQRSNSSSRDNGLTGLIRDLVDQLKEQSEEIGALRQENAALKYRLAQIAEDVGNASSVPA